MQTPTPRPRLSVVIPTYNSADVLLRCVSSVLEQAVPDLEVIVVDDGSEDDAAGALSTLQSDQRVRLVRQGRAGVSVARNRGVRESRGEFVMFVDSDDHLQPNSLRPFLEFAVGAAADVVVSDFLLSGEHDTQVVRALNTERQVFGAEDRGVFQWLTLARVGFQGRPNVGLLGAPWAKIYSRSFFDRRLAREDLFLPGLTRGQDVLFNAEVFGEADRVAYWPRATYSYTVSTNSASHRPASDFENKVIALQEGLQNLLTVKQWDHLRPAVAKMVVTLFEETLLRLGSSLSSANVREVRSRHPVPESLSRARLRDFSAVGRVKLLAFRIGPRTTFILMRGLRQVRSRSLGT